MDLAMLNRLRVNAGKPELKSWKASGAKLKAAIKGFQDQGFTDTVAGANLDAKPVPPADPEVIKALNKGVQLDDADKKQIKDEAEDRKVTKVKPGLARGADQGAFTEHSRKAVQDERERERKANKKKRQEKKKLQKGEVDPKKEPEKAARQKKHIEEKRAKRAAEGKLKPAKEKNDKEVTVADIARDLDINPKIARSKLRRHEDKLTKLHTKGQDRWTFPKTARKEIEKILKGSK